MSNGCCTEEKPEIENHPTLIDVLSVRPGEDEGHGKFISFGRR